MTDATPRQPLTDNEFHTRGDLLQSAYIWRRSDEVVTKFIRTALGEREWWLTRRGPSARADHGQGPMAPGADGTGRSTPQDKFQTRGALVIGESGAGKSRLVNGALVNAGLPPENDGRSLTMLYQQVPGPCSLGALGRELLRTLRYPIADSAKQPVVWAAVRKQLALADVKVLHLDEIQNVLETANKLETRDNLAALKNLMNDPVHPVILLMSGLPSFIEHAEREDQDQVRRRCQFVPLETLGTAQAGILAKAIAGMAAKVDLKLQDGFEEHVVPRLLHAGRGLVGLCMEISVGAAKLAIGPEDREGRRLPPETVLSNSHFAARFAELSGNAAFANPFLAPEWYLLDPTKRAITSPSQLAAPPEPMKRRRRPRGSART